MPETPYVFEARKFRLRNAVLVLLTLVALLSTVETAAGWLVVLLALATGVKTIADRRAHAATVASAAKPAARWYEQ